MKVYCYYFDLEKREDKVECVQNSGKAWRTLQIKVLGYVWMGYINNPIKGCYYSLKELTRRERKILNNYWEQM